MGDSLDFWRWSTFMQGEITAMDYGFKFYVDGQITAMNSEFKIGNEEGEPLVGPEDPSMVMMQPILQNRQENVIESHFDVRREPWNLDDTYPQIVNLTESDYNITFTSENSDSSDFGSLQFDTTEVLEFNSLDEFIHSSQSGRNEENLVFHPGPSQNEKRKELGVKETTKKDPCKKQNPKTKESVVKKGCKRGPYKKKNSKIPPTPGILIQKTKPTKKKKLYTQKSVLDESPTGLTDSSENAQQNINQQLSPKERRWKKSTWPRITPNVIFDQCYEALGTWRKITRLRSGENPKKHSDSYIFTPDNKQLRSDVDLIVYLSKNPKYWPYFDAKIINFEKNNTENPTPATGRVIDFLNGVRKGVDVETAMSIFLKSKSKKIKTVKEFANFQDDTTKNYFSEIQD